MVGRDYGVYSTWLVLWSGHEMCFWAACRRLPAAVAVGLIMERNVKDDSRPGVPSSLVWNVSALPAARLLR